MTIEMEVPLPDMTVLGPVREAVDSEHEGRGAVARGAEVLALARKGVDAVNDHFTAKLTPEEMQQFLNAVEKLTADENEQLTNL